MPNSEATARGHLRKTPTAQPHSTSDAVSALRRHHKASIIQDTWKKRLQDTTKPPLPTFDPTKSPRSTTLHLDCTGALPERCSSGTLFLMVSCYGSYIHIKPLSSLQGSQTSEALSRNKSWIPQGLSTYLLRQVLASNRDHLEYATPLRVRPYDFGLSRCAS